MSFSRADDLSLTPVQGHENPKKIQALAPASDIGFTLTCTHVLSTLGTFRLKTHAVDSDRYS